MSEVNLSVFSDVDSEKDPHLDGTTKIPQVSCSYYARPQDGAVILECPAMCMCFSPLAST